MPLPKLRLPRIKARPDNYDYRDDAGVGLDDWDQFYQDVYYRPPGNSGKNRNPAKGHLGGLPVTPLYFVYRKLKASWRAANLGEFSPFFATEVHKGPYRPDFCNPEARLLYAIVKWCDDSYSYTNIAQLADGFKKFFAPAASKRKRQDQAKQAKKARITKRSNKPRRG